MFICTTVLLLIVGNLVARSSLVVGFETIDVQLLAPNRDAWYIDSAPGIESMSHSVLYYSMNESIANARASELLLLGNSRTLFAFPYEQMDAFAADHHLDYFNLAFGHAESMEFAKLIMERHSLCPGIVLINSDAFFQRGLSEMASTVIGHSKFGSAKEQLESWGAFQAQHYLSARIPRCIPPNGFASHSGIFRSVKNGNWHVWNRGDRAIPVDLAGGDNLLSDEQIMLATDFRDWLSRRGSRMVLTHVPSSLPLGTQDRSQRLARALDVPILLCSESELSTCDESHLNPKSGQLFSKQILGQLSLLMPLLLDRSQPADR